MTLCYEACGGFTIVGSAEALEVDQSGALLLLADHDYVVKISTETVELPLAGALRQLQGATEGVLRFSGFVGDAELGGRVLRVRSPKLEASQVEEMLHAVARQFASLPFAFATPAGAPFSRELTSGPNIPYQALILILDALAGRGKHDLRAALARILANPYSVLRTERARVPLPLADRLGPTTLVDALTSADLSPVLPSGHSMASSPAAVAFKRRLPERLTVERVRSDTDNPENRFVAGVLEECLRVVDLVLAYARGSTAAGASALEKQCVEAHETLRIWRRHRGLADLRALAAAPLNSTVLQRQSGYRDVLSFWMDLIGRTRWLPSSETLSRLALRDAPTLYEYWCYFEVLAAVTETEGTPVRVDQPSHDEAGARLRWSSRAEFGSGVSVIFNERFAGRESSVPGPKSASVPLRPDIVLRHPTGSFHVLDAKFRRAGVATYRADEAAEGEDAAKQADVHKMHAYRDALGALSSWVLYPGQGQPAEFPPHGETLEDGQPVGVGTIPLAPGNGGREALRRIVKRMLQAA